MRPPTIKGNIVLNTDVTFTASRPSSLRNDNLMHNIKNATTEHGENHIVRLDKCNSDVGNPQKQNCQICGCNTIAIVTQCLKEVPQSYLSSLPCCSPCFKNISDRSVEKKCVPQYPVTSNTRHSEEKLSVATPSDKNKPSSDEIFPPWASRNLSIEERLNIFKRECTISQATWLGSLSSHYKCNNSNELMKNIIKTYGSDDIIGRLLTKCEGIKKAIGATDYLKLGACRS